MLAVSDALRDRLDRDSWTLQHELLASVLELLSVIRIEACLIAGVPRHKVPDPVHVPRPGDPPPEEQVTTVTPSQFARMMVTDDVAYDDGLPLAADTNGTGEPGQQTDTGTPYGQPTPPVEPDPTTEPPPYQTARR